MKQPYSLATRTFLLSFLSMCVLLAAGFFALSATLKGRIKEGLKLNLKRTEQQLDQSEADYHRRETALMGSLSENTSLKAGMALAREQTNRTSRDEVRSTIEDQLREMARGLDYAFFVVMDTGGAVVETAGSITDDALAHHALAIRSRGPSVVRLGNELYDVTNVPVNLGTDNLGTLAVGKRFNLSLPGVFGYAVLLDRFGIVGTTFPEALQETVARQLTEQCGAPTHDCEVSAGGQSYLVLHMNRAWLGPGYHLLYAISIDNAMAALMRGLQRAFILTGLAGMLIAVLFSWLASLSIAKPLADLAAQMEISGETGARWSELGINSSTREVNLLAGALNRAGSARQLVERELWKSKEKAESASRAKSEFIANVSHELRTPMNGILGMTGLVLDSELTVAQRQDLELVKTSADALMMVINNILSFSQTESGAPSLDLVEFNLRDCLSECVKTEALRVHNKGLELYCEFNPEAPAVVFGDSVRLRQVLANLLDNAIKFTERGAILVRADIPARDSQKHQAECVAHFMVQDTGVGIPPEKQKLIFESFVQADGSTTRKYTGVGLGLSISQRQVKIMGGEIWVESKVGRGSRFHFTIPLLAQSESVTEPSAPVALKTIPARSEGATKLSQGTAACADQDIRSSERLRA